MDEQGRVTNEQVAQEAFDAKLEELVDKMSGGELLAVPGVYEVLREHLNNEVIEALESDCEED